MKPHLLIVDDDQAYASDLALVLEAEFHCSLAHNPVQAEERINGEMPAVVLLDLNLGPDVREFSLLERIREMAPELPVVMMSDQPSISKVVEAVRRGVFGFLQKSAGLEELKLVLHKAAGWSNDQPTGDNR